MNSADVETLIEQVVASTKMNGELLEQFIKSVASRNVDLKLVEKWLKAIHQHGISGAETTQLTKGMMHSGEMIQWVDNSLVVDKHSTGGVGDKMSLMLAPILAACGLMVPMLAGRGLGHTGGTIDKLESIPGFNCSLNPSEMKHQVREISCCIAAQNDAIAPADGLLYAVRDVTNTIDSVPLITASIISKKAAEGLGALVLDVKCGSAAFMQSLPDAEELATSMVEAAKGLGIKTIAQITQMDYPIGRYIGNSLEVLGSINVLKGKGSPDTLELVLLQCEELLVMTKLANTYEKAREMINAVISDGSALEKFHQMCIYQGVHPKIAKQLIEQPTSILPQSAMITEITALGSGYLSNINAMTLAEIARSHGAGRFTIDDSITPEIGFEILPNRGDYISEGEVWLAFHHNEDIDDDTMLKLVQSIHLSDEPIKQTGRLIGKID